MEVSYSCWKRRVLPLQRCLLFSLRRSSTRKTRKAPWCFFRISFGRILKYYYDKAFGVRLRLDFPEDFLSLSKKIWSTCWNFCLVGRPTPLVRSMVSADFCWIWWATTQALNACVHGRVQDSKPQVSKSPMNRWLNIASSWSEDTKTWKHHFESIWKLMLLVYIYIYIDP